MNRGNQKRSCWTEVGADRRERLIRNPFWDLHGIEPLRTVEGRLPTQPALRLPEGTTTLVLLSPPHGASDRLARSAARPALEQAAVVARVSRFDGRTHVLAVRTELGWRRSRRLPWTRQTVEHLRGDVREVLLSRFFRRARVPLSWIPVAHR